MIAFAQSLPLERPSTSPVGLPPQFGPSQQLLPLKINLNAGETRQFSIQGQWLYVKECYGTPGAFGAEDFLIGTDITGPIPFNVGTGMRFPDSAQFKLLQIENPNAYGIYVEIVAGYGSYIDNRLNIVRVRVGSLQPVIEPPIEISPWVGNPPGTFTIPAFGFVAFTPALTGLRIGMKGFTVANADPNSPVQIRNAAGIPFGYVVKDTSQLFPGSQAFQVFNSTGVPIVCYVGILYWLGPA